MAITVLTNAQVIINSVDLSNRIDQVTIDTKVADIDVTTFGATARQHSGGLRDDSVTLEFFQDFALAEVDATIAPLIGTLTSINIKPVNAATSSVNPAYTGNVLVTEYKPLDGKVGDASKISVTWPCNGALTRNIV